MERIKHCFRILIGAIALTLALVPWMLFWAILGILLEDWHTWLD